MNFDIVKLLQKIEQLEQQRDKLLAAGKALVYRWDTPLWKDATHTGEFIATLRKIIAEIDKGK